MEGVEGQRTSQRPACTLECTLVRTSAICASLCVVCEVGEERGHAGREGSSWTRTGVSGVRSFDCVCGLSACLRAGPSCALLFG